MTNETAKGLLDFLLPDIRQESAITRKVLAAVPAENYQYKPSGKCMSGLELSSHIAVSEAFFLRGVIHGNFEWKQQEFASPAAVVAYYDETIPALIEELAALPSEKLAQPVAFHTMNYPAVHYLVMNLKHGVHHRGQLSAYLRPMGAKVPSIYGGSADEPMQAAAE
jgi:uncharacterized damage-inducible protein DinB